MIKNYLKIAWRGIRRHKLYSLINITGLSVGLAACITMMVYVAHELSYDRFHKNADRIFVPQAQIKMGGNVLNMDYMSYASAPIISRSLPSVKATMRTLSVDKPVVVSNTLLGKKFTDNHLLFADGNFFKFFSFKLLEGSPSQVLNKPFSVVISKELARKYFGNEDPVGRNITLKTDSTYNYRVTGVADDAPSNSSIQFDMVASASALPELKEAKKYMGGQNLGPGSFSLYVLLKSAADTTALLRGLKAVPATEKAFPDEKFHLTALTDMHLHNNFSDSSRLKYLSVFPLVAALILLLALINYMSLSTARATLRAKEVAVRKISGADRKTIARQFYVESALFTILSFVLGYLLSYVFTPVFLNILQLKIDSSFLYSPLVLGLLGGLLLLTIFIAGSYPALVLSSFKPAVALKGKAARQTGGVAVRRVFTTLQFAISIALIICGIVIDRQLYFFRHTDTGVDRENVVMIPVSSSFGKNYPAFRQDVASMAGISSVATSHYPMFGGYDMYFFDGKAPGKSVGMAALSVDVQFIKTLGLKWVYPPKPGDNIASRSKVVLNQRAVDKLGLPPNAVGSYIKSGNQKVEVAGVLKDFNFTSLQDAIAPLGLFLAPDTTAFWSKAGCNLFARINPHTNLPSLLAKIKQSYRKYDQETTFSYTFMDDAFNAQYKAEDRLASIFSVFTGITIVLAAMGLFGLAAFTIEQRTKEIGIRKVLGASIIAINTLLSGDFLKLVLLAIAIAAPIAWWTMHRWLQSFAYRINIQWWMFAVAGLAAVIIAIATISYHSIRAALGNPVESLRSE